MSSTDQSDAVAQESVKKLLGFEDIRAEGPIEGAASPVFALSRLDTSALEASPIDPAWIVDGAPEARSKNFSRLGDCWTVVDHWSCTEGRFRWHYAFDETILILEGEAFITDDNGASYHATPGTTLFFPYGSAANWHVPAYVRKVAFNQRHVPSYLHKILRAITKLQNKLFGRGPATGV